MKMNLIIWQKKCMHANVLCGGAQDFNIME